MRERGSPPPSPNPLRHVPRKTEIQRVPSRRSERVWVPAFTGNTDVGAYIFLKTRPPTPASPVLPPEGEDLLSLIFPLWGKWPEGP